MACFLVPATEAIIGTIVEKTVKVCEEKHAETRQESELRLSDKISWLNKMLWGGSALLAFEHVWHGEVSPFYPFLTAMENADNVAVMLHEMSTVGVSMAAVVTVVWAIMVAVTGHMRKKADEPRVEASSTECKALIPEEVTRD